ncbi:cyclin 5, putative [Bodo saltans]|uniref:Cyclin 5, putative n=1 Tax=Bodo saltans TaxID=75058 RepID=A0A0S4IN97_BODSA|nr:cyclin 5, putative [Bodo saltans]|eukprot:CUF63542.1 cyclin 5, putative [Bodo saltans]
MVQQGGGVNHSKQQVGSQQAGGFRGMIGQLRGVAEGLLANRWGGGEQQNAHSHETHNQPLTMAEYAPLHTTSSSSQPSSGLVELVTTHEDGGSFNTYGSWENHNQRRKPRKDSSQGSMPPRQRLLRAPDDAETSFSAPPPRQAAHHDEKDRSVVEILSQAMSARSLQSRGHRYHDGTSLGADRPADETPAPPIQRDNARQRQQHLHREEGSAHESHRKNRHVGPKHSKAASVFSRDAIAKMDLTHRNDEANIPEQSACSRLRSRAETERKTPVTDEGMLDIAPLVALACDRIAAMSSAQHHAAAARRRSQVTPDHQDEGPVVEDHSLSCCARTSVGKPPRGPFEAAPVRQAAAVVSASLGSFDAPHSARQRPIAYPSKRLLARSEEETTNGHHTTSAAPLDADMVSIQSVIEAVSTSIAYGGSGRMVVVAALVYIGRLSGMCDCDRYRVSKVNHMRTATVCLLAATKMYIEADQSPRKINAAFSKASGISLGDLARLEVTLLFLLDFSLIVDEPEARRWCQWLHDVALRKGMEAPLHSFFQTSPRDTANSPCTPGASMTQTPPTASLDAEYYHHYHNNNTMTPMTHHLGTPLPLAVAHSRTMSGQTGHPSPLPTWAPLPSSLPSQSEPSPMALGAAAVPMTMASPLALQPLSHPEGGPSPTPAAARVPSDTMHSCRLFSCMFQTHADGTLSPPTSSDEDEAPPSPPHEDRSPMRSFLSHGPALNSPPSPPRRDHPSDVLRDFSRLVRHASAASVPLDGGDESDHGLGRQRRVAVSPPSDLAPPRRRMNLSPPDDDGVEPRGGAARFLRMGRGGGDRNGPPPPAPDDDDRWRALQRRQYLSPPKRELQTQSSTVES